MSTNFSCNQFESAYKSNRLQNYEIPRQFKEYPSRRRGHTQFIANDKGHVLSEKWRSSVSPWGHFVGTWQAPRKPIKLQVKTKFMSQQMREKSRPSTAPASVAQQEGSKSPSTSQPEDLEKTKQIPGTEEQLSPGGSKKDALPSEQSLPCTPGEDGRRSNSAMSERPTAPTPSYISGSRKSQRLSSASPIEKGSIVSSRMQSAPSSRQQSSLGKKEGGGSPQPNESIVTSTSPDEHRPHSRQVSRESSGIGTSNGTRIYTPPTTVGGVGKGGRESSLRSSTAAESCTTARSNRKDVGIQCPSNNI
ncbi:PREDICTED: protein Flattop homolog [Amphimedon queenslandica]|uniref:Cilia- and flagella-associated protein 126 n=1 Tax=Amphimedon queenslandica TaxID=400682 RepID=A0A1X7TZ66_AMPQE|nr:PREDICTED: protein Flattop homolog [Amphimedon queenslandica]|eukprot:XP_003389399.1 PREDICTED: protein Flattop homolog [Amphimedon queenslandica]